MDGFTSKLRKNFFTVAWHYHGRSIIVTFASTIGSKATKINNHLERQNYVHTPNGGVPLLSPH